ncbi:transporter [Scleromatobacter humisilvae]|uniref:Transporter n=1 Tax=Scleromatobacter humisilvae TaxID=2897159 RepID=A0A9X2C2L0_9BURK|nr:transporter [Scleromatobacter humisilvae]MCK9688786.1 transporter [Scleromatobacter humisilvae]
MKTSLLIASTLLACAVSAHADDTPAPDDGGPAVVPYRPSVSTPAQLSAPGYLELEAGGLRAAGPARGMSRTSLPYALKLAFTPDWGIRVGGDAWVRQAEPGDAQSGGGDTSVVLKRRFAVSDATAWGLELGETFATAKSAIGIGHDATTVNAIFSSDFAPSWHTDINLNETHVGGQSPASAWQAGWAAAFSRTLTDAWGVSGEFSGTHQSGVGNTAQFLAAASWNQSPAAVFDFGAAHGLNDASPRWQVFAGVTVRLGKLF